MCIRDRNSDDITEGSLNTFHTTARVNTQLGAFSTNIVPDGNVTRNVGSAGNKLNTVFTSTVTGLTTPVNADDAANKTYVDNAITSAGGTNLSAVGEHIIPTTDITYDLGSSSQQWKDIYIDGVAYLDAIDFNGTTITATAAELNILDGVTSTAAELNILDGVTSTAAELNILDGVTATATEINLIDGGTSRGTTAFASGDGVLHNDGGVMRMTNITKVRDFVQANISADTITEAMMANDAIGQNELKTVQSFRINDSGGNSLFLMYGAGA